VDYDSSFQPFPADTLPEPLRDFVNLGARAIGCDTSYVGVPLLAMLASAIGNTRRIELKRGTWTEPAVLWTAIVGKSGTLKSPALDMPLAPMRARQAQALKTYEQKREEYEAALEAHEIAKKNWRSKGAKKGEPCPKVPPPPVCERFYCSDVTVEALVDRLQDAPRGLLVVRDELSGLVQGFGQYKQGRGGDVAHWLSMHRAGEVFVDRKSGDKTTIYVPRAAVCITGGIQPAILRRCLTREYHENGFAARLLMTMPPSRAKRWTDAVLPADVQARVEAVFGRIFELEMNQTADGSFTPVDVPLSPGAKTLFVEFYDAHAAEQAKLSDDLAAAWSKLEGYCARLALVLCYARWALGLASGDEIDATSMSSGIVLTRWFCREALRVYEMFGETDEERERRELVELVRRKGGRVTARDVMRSTRRYPTADDAIGALEDAAQAGLLVVETRGSTPTGGRCTGVFRLPTDSELGADVDTVDVDTTEKNHCKGAVASTVGSVNAEFVPTETGAEREVIEL